MAMTKEDFEKRSPRGQYEAYDEVCDVLKAARHGAKVVTTQINDFLSEHTDAKELYAFCTDGGDIMELVATAAAALDIVMRYLPVAAEGADRLDPDDKTHCSACGK